MRVPLLTLALAACSPPAPAQDQGRNEVSPAFTREAAASLPLGQLADRAFRDLGARMTAVSRPSSPDSPLLERLVFAGAPHPASVGLCGALRVELDYAPSGSDQPTSPARLNFVRAAEVYKVTGSVEPYVEVSEARAAEEARRCAAAGPVIPASEGDASRAYYFTFEGDDLPELSLLVLQEAISDARSGRYRAIGCAGSVRSSPECRNPAALLGGLDPANLVSLQIAPVGLNRNRALVRARFLIPGDPQVRRHWSVAIEADISRPPDEAESIERLGRTEIASSDPASD